MDFGYAVQLLREGVFQVLFSASPILITGMVVGLVIAIIQATTSLQEQTLSFVPKIAAVLVVLLLLGPWIGQLFIQYTTNLFQQIPNMVQ